MNASANILYNDYAEDYPKCLHTPKYISRKVKSSSNILYKDSEEDFTFRCISKYLSFTICRLSLLSLLFCIYQKKYLNILKVYWSI